MKKHLTYILPVLCLLLCSATSNKDKNVSGHDLTTEMFAATKSIKSMTFHMRKLERIDGKLVDQKSFIKLKREPMSVYSRQLYPTAGLEVLYKGGDAKALINPNGFPWVNLSLDPYGNTMRKNQHHTIHDAGYDLVVSILEHLFSKYGPESKTMTEILGTELWDGNVCWVIDIKNPHFKYENYTVKEGENLITIAEQYKISEYMILENNKAVSSYYDVKPGQVIKIPNDYSPHFTLLLDQKRLIPLVMKIYDDKGLYEQYEYTDLDLNPEMDEAEFSSDFPDYGF